MKVQPYVFFEGRFDEAAAFYRAAIGAEVAFVMRFADSPDQSHVTPENAAKVMHAELRIGETTVLASDGTCSGQPNFSGAALAITAESDAEAERMFAALADGGQTVMPIAGTFFATRFGMTIDRFGLTWMVMSGSRPP
ncbi:MAG: VOC family protein [Acetobacteraceae bacterium]|nr:VOC family protein [Pseudomonadota bacterium]